MKKKYYLKVKHLDKIINRWTNSQEILLRAGEMTRSELRTVMAVVNGFARELKEELELPL